MHSHVIGKYESFPIPSLETIVKYKLTDYYFQTQDISNYYGNLRTNKFAFQRIPRHCNIIGNEMAETNAEIVAGPDQIQSLQNCILNTFANNNRKNGLEDGSRKKWPKLF